MDLGRFGVWTSYRAIGEERAGAAARLLEDLGFGTVWLGGSPQVPALRPLLAATDHIVAATGILNIWRSDPDQVRADFDELNAEFPDRVMVGIGVGHPEVTSDYTRPLTAMRRFLDGLDRDPDPVPSDQRCLAALAPRMLGLARDRSRGSHTYFVSVEHTRGARERLGEGPLLAPELACVLDEDPVSARAKARAYAKLYLGLGNYTRGLLDYGFTEQDIVDGGSDRLIDTIVAHGSPRDVVAAAHEYVRAGADHVCFQAVGVEGIPRAEWTALAGAVDA